MNCPNCNVPLAITDRQGVEIDYCPQCRGVWLDRGELDKLIERSARLEQEYRQSPPDDRRDDDRRDYERREPQPQYDQRYKEGYRDGYKYDEKGRPYKKKKESWIGELFDF